MREAVSFDGGLVSASPDWDGDFGVVVTCKDASGRERWKVKCTSYMGGTFPSQASNYVIATASAEIVDGLLFIVSRGEGCKDSTPAFTNLHRVLEGGRVAWGMMVDPSGGAVAMRRTVQRLEVDAAWDGSVYQTRVFDVDTGRRA